MEHSNDSSARLEDIVYIISLILPIVKRYLLLFFLFLNAQIYSYTKQQIYLAVIMIISWESINV